MNSGDNNAVILALTQTIETLNQTVNELKKTIENQNAKYESLMNDYNLIKEENACLRRKLFGTKSEKLSNVSPEQLSFFDEAEILADDSIFEKQTITYDRKTNRIKGERDIKLEKLPHKKIVCDIEEKDKNCPECGKPMKCVGEEFIRREVVYQPAKVYVKEIYRKTYKCPTIHDNKIYMLKAEMPNPVIPHSYASASLVAGVMNEKYVKAVPLYRQESMWKSLGLEISRNTLANWMIISANEYLKPLVDRMHELLVEDQYIHSDETTVQVMNEEGKKNTTKSYMWVYSSIKEREKQIKIFEYCQTRKAENAEEFLKGFKGYLITDAYAGYGTLENVTNCYCWAHARRCFHEALPKEATDEITSYPGTALKKIGALFNIETEIENLSAQEKVKIRQEKSKPLVDDFFSWCKDKIDSTMSGSKTYKAFQYAINHEEGLRQYLKDGYLPMTNSLDERTIRPFTIGRKNWLFSGSPRGAESSATIYSMVETAKANHLNPQDYLEIILNKMPDEQRPYTNEILDKYLPWSPFITDQLKEETKGND